MTDLGLLDTTGNASSRKDIIIITNKETPPNGREKGRIKKF